MPILFGFFGLQDVLVRYKLVALIRNLLSLSKNVSTVSFNAEAVIESDKVARPPYNKVIMFLWLSNSSFNFVSGGW
jgi:hypothetical protein